MCEATCEGEADCVPSVAPVCLARCVTSTDCRDGYQCFLGNCRPLCRADSECAVSGARCHVDGTCEGAECAVGSDCGPGQTCRAGSCVEAPPDAGGGVPPGTPCAGDSDCGENGICLPAALGGVCSLACVDANDCFVFTTAAGCSAVPTDDDGDGSPDSARALCVLAAPGSQSVGRPCAGDDDCIARICQDRQCTEVCDDDLDCVVGQTCASLPRAGVPGAIYMGCGYGPISGTTVEEVSLGSIDLQVGFVRRLELATPPDAVSLTLQARQAGGPARDIGFLSVIDPANARIFDGRQIAMLVDQPIRWLPIDTGESATMLIPNTTPDRVTFVPGLHQWSVGPIPEATGDSVTTSLELSALLVRAPGGVVTSGRIGLNIHLCGLRGGLTAATAGSDTMLQNSLTRLGAILAPTGVSIGTVRYFDVPDARFQVIDTTDGPTSELAELFRQSAGRTGRGLNVFLVRSIEAGGGGFRALGVAGGIPGPVGIHGTYHAGVVSSFDTGVVGTGMTGSNVVGQILAHELGHYVGLYHSTEQARPCGPGENPVDDACSPFGGGDQLVDTARGDDTNLLYWSIVGGGTNTNLTAGQGHVFRMSALTHD